MLYERLGVFMKDEKNDKEEQKELGTDVEKEVTDGVSVIFHIIFIYLFFFGLIIHFFLARLNSFGHLECPTSNF